MARIKWLNGDCFYAPWGTWNAKEQKIQDPGESNTEFTNNHVFTKCWSFADLRTQAKERKLIRNAFDGIQCYLSKKEEEIYGNLLKINTDFARNDNHAVIICGSKKTQGKIFGDPKNIGVILIRKDLINKTKLKQIAGDKIIIQSKRIDGIDYFMFSDIQPEQLVTALKSYNELGQAIELFPARSYDAHDFSKIIEEPDIVSDINRKIKKNNMKLSPSPILKRTNSLRFKITSYGVLGTDGDYDTKKNKNTPLTGTENSDGLENRCDFVIVDPAGAAFRGSAEELQGSTASGAIYKVAGFHGTTIAKSRPTLKSNQEGIKINSKNKVINIESGYAVFNNIWQPDNLNTTPAGVIHAVGPDRNHNGEERQRILTQTLKNIFIQYHNCNAVDLNRNKAGLRIPAISSGVFGGNTDDRAKYEKMLFEALTQGYNQACQELNVDNIDFGEHGLEVCFYGKNKYVALKTKIEEVRYKKTLTTSISDEYRKTIEGNLFHPQSFSIAKQIDPKKEFTETIIIADNNHQHDFFIGSKTRLENNESKTITDTLKKHLGDAKNDSGLTEYQAGIIMLIAIKNGGISNKPRQFFQDIQAIDPSLNNDDFFRKACKFSSSFQKKNSDQSILTGNPSPKTIVGMRLKRLTIDYAYEMLADKSKFDGLCEKLKIDKSGYSQEFGSRVRSERQVQTSQPF